MKYADTRACTPKCHSAQHADQLIALMTRTGDTQILLSGIQQCYNCQKVHDKIGRYLLHMAASCGRSEVCQWLVNLKRAELHLKTTENGWTPAHCAAFHGHIDTLVVLIKLGANVIKNDHDRLTPIEHLSIDKWLCLKNQPDLNGIVLSFLKNNVFELKFLQMGY